MTSPVTFPQTVRSVFALIATALVFPQIACAQWEKLNGPLTALPFCMAQKPGKIYLGTTAGIYTSGDNGDTWNEIPYNTRYPGFPKALESAGDALYMTTYDVTLNQDVMLRTYDEGQNWERVLIFDGGSVDNTRVGKDILVIGDTILFYLDFYGMVSVDDGASSFSHSINTGGGVYDFGGYWPFKGYIYAMNYIGAIGRSPDNGLTWEFVYTVPAGGYCLAAIGERLFAGGNNHLCYSTDGNTWTQAAVVGIGYVERIFGEGQRVYALASGGTFTSTDGGMTWTKVVSPVFVGVPIHTAAMIDGRLFVGTPEGLFISDSGWNGLERVPLNAPNIGSVIENNGRLFATTNHGYFFSDNQGQSWSAFQSDALNPAYSEWFVPSEFLSVNGILFLRHSFMTKLARSPNNGQQWEWTQDVPQVQTIIRDIVGSNNKLIAITDNKMFRTSNAGDSWEPIFFETPQTPAVLEKMENNQGVLVLLRPVGIIFLSFDGGDTWEKIDPPPAAIEFVSAIYPYNGRLWVSTDAGLFVYDLAGGQWLDGYPEVVPADTSEVSYARPPVVRVFREVAGLLVAAVSDNGLFVLKPDMTWKKLPDQPGNHRTSDIFYKNGVVYLGMHGGGIWKNNANVLPATEVADTGTILPSPNPAADLLTVKTNLRESGRLTILNSAGKIILQKQVETATEITIPVETLESGLYFITLATGDRVLTGRFVRM